MNLIEFTHDNDSCLEHQLGFKANSFFVDYTIIEQKR